MKYQILKDHVSGEKKASIVCDHLGDAIPQVHQTFVHNQGDWSITYKISSVEKCPITPLSYICTIEEKSTFDMGDL
jgi:hypothetical protein